MYHTCFALYAICNVIIQSLTFIRITKVIGIDIMHYCYTDDNKKEKMFFHNFFVLYYILSITYFVVCVLFTLLLF